jgi:hypothetical protein
MINEELAPKPSLAIRIAGVAVVVSTAIPYLLVALVFLCAPALPEGFLNALVLVPVCLLISIIGGVVLTLVRRQEIWMVLALWSVIATVLFCSLVIGLGASRMH